MFGGGNIRQYCGDVLRVYGDNGKENGSYCSGL